MNEVKLSGILCSNIKEIENGVIFSLNFVNGKNKDGSYKNAFVNCRYFGSKNDLPEPKSRITVTGWLCDNAYEKDGKKINNLVIFTKDVKLNKTPEQRGEVSYHSNNNSFDSSMPWD